MKRTRVCQFAGRLTGWHRLDAVECPVLVFGGNHLTGGPAILLHYLDSAGDVVAHELTFCESPVPGPSAPQLRGPEDRG